MPQRIKENWRKEYIYSFPFIIYNFEAHKKEKKDKKHKKSKKEDKGERQSEIKKKPTTKIKIQAFGALEALQSDSDEEEVILNIVLLIIVIFRKLQKLRLHGLLSVAVRLRFYRCCLLQRPRQSHQVFLDSGHLIRRRYFYLLLSKRFVYFF